MTAADIIRDIYACVPRGTSEPRDASTISRLRVLTQALLEAYCHAGLLEQHPFCGAASRCISCNSAALESLIAGKAILVTGGEGTVGRHLISSLAQFAPKHLVSVDIVPARCAVDDCRSYRQVDVGRFDMLSAVFREYRPDFVFHLAASREPAYAEQDPKAAVASNIVGAANVFRLCKDFAVAQCVHASTGKAARYYTPDVYAASKKLAEWQLVHAALDCSCIFTAVRFTHIIENSIVAREMQEKIDAGLVSFHSHDRFLVVQNLAEAVTLLMNALVVAQPSVPSVLTTRDLGWPVEVLRLPLYLMKTRGEVAPLWFRGVPNGYELDLFRGQLDWDRLDQFGPMINALEASAANNDPTGQMTIAPLTTCAQEPLQSALTMLGGIVENPCATHDDVRSVLAAGVWMIGDSSLERVPVDLLWRILQTGVNVEAEAVDALIGSHTPTISLLARAVAHRSTAADLATVDARAAPCISDIVSVLRRIDGLESTVAQLCTLGDSVTYG